MNHHFRAETHTDTNTAQRVKWGKNRNSIIFKIYIQMYFILEKQFQLKLCVHCADHCAAKAVVGTLTNYIY